jgi:hypothetical protein
MNVLKGTMRNGLIVLDDPGELPEGTRVEVLPVETVDPVRGMREEEWPTTPEGMAALLAWMDQVEVGWLSPDEEAAWRAALREQKELDKAKFFKNAEELQSKWG